MAQEQLLIIGLGVAAVGALAYFTGMLCAPLNICPPGQARYYPGDPTQHGAPYPAGGRTHPGHNRGYGDDGYGDDGGYGDDYDFESSAAQISVA